MNLIRKGTIISVKQIAKRTIETAIKTPEGFNFVAGQYIWLMVPGLKYPDPRGNTRMFSIASSPNKKGELDLVFRDSKSGYKKTIVEMLPGAEIFFSGPFGAMRLPEGNSLPIMFMAGGVGVAPFLSMVRFSNETNSGHRITLFYANTNEKEAAYLDELTRMENGNSNFKLVSITGLLKKSRLEKSVKEYVGQEAIWSVVGPKGFVDLVGDYLNKQGVLLRDVIFEQFYPELPFKK